MRKKLISVLLSMAMVASILAGCSGSGSSNKESESGSTAAAKPEGETITFMAPDWAIPSDEQLDAFTEETGIEVVVSEVGWDDIREKLATAAVREIG